MFTHDVRKKAKKWHDGSLRFHTFNKRVMVYDDTKNLVGSLHYRSQDDFAEGLELNLDSHVLVQVEEKLSESTTDLTQLLSRQKQDGVDNFVKPDPPTRATLTRINAANSQIKPKSIKELLAGSQGSIGRARFPSRSPYEQRHSLTESQPPEPVADPEPKRRKIIHDKENDVEVTQRAQPSTKKTTPAVHAQPSPPSEVVDVSSDDDPPVLPQQGRRNSMIWQIAPRSTETVTLPSSTTSTAKRNFELPAPAEPKRRKKDQQAQPAPSASAPKEAASRKPKMARQELTENTTKPSSAPPTTTKTSTADTYISQIRHSTGPRSSLKFTAEKRRPKLMYRALLADSSKPACNLDSTAATSQSVNNVSSNRSHDTEPQTRRQRVTNMLDTDQMFAPSQIRRDTTAAAANMEFSRESLPSRTSPSPDFVGDEVSRPSPEPAHSSPAVSAPDQGDAETVPDSPLFLPRTISQASPVPTQDSVVDSGHVAFLSQALQTTTSRRPPSPAQEAVVASQTSIETEDPRLLSEPPSSPVFQRRRPADPSPGKSVSASIPLEADEVHHTMSAPSPAMNKAVLPLPPTLPAQVRPFRRVASENIQRPAMSSGVSTSNSDDDDDSSNDLLRNNAPDKDLDRLVKPVAQSHSFSDPVEMRPTSPTQNSAPSSPEFHEDVQQMDNDHAAAIANATTEYISIEESGPWTSTEAFLLFDWWPPGRPKPAYAANTTAIGALDRAESSSANRNEQNISSNPMSKKKYGTFGSAKFVSQR